MSDHASPESSERRVTTRYEPARIKALTDDLISAVQAAHFPDASAFALRIALEEAVANAYKHGHKGRAERPMHITWKVDPNRVVLTVEDEGEGFSPEAVPDPTEDDRLELPSGRGLLMMRSFMSDVRYNERGNRVTMVYDKPDE